MNNNEKIKELLDDFTDPYSNSKVDLLVEKLSDSEIFEVKHIQEITTYLISKKGFCDLCYTYTDKDFETIDTAIDCLIEENLDKDHYESIELQNKQSQTECNYCKHGDLCHDGHICLMAGCDCEPCEFTVWNKKQFAQDHLTYSCWNCGQEFPSGQVKSLAVDDVYETYCLKCYEDKK